MHTRIYDALVERELAGLRRESRAVAWLALGVMVAAALVAVLLDPSILTRLGDAWDAAERAENSALPYAPPPLPPGPA
jgi:hypothetical protein